MQPADYPGVDDAFGHWLAGFIDGEGSFAIQRWQKSQRESAYYTCRFSLKVRADEEPILREVWQRTGIGTLGYRRKVSGNPMVDWQIQAKPDALALVRLLDRYPLRAKKAGDYAIWREAVLEWQRVVPTVRYDWSRIAQLKTALSDGKAFDAGLVTLKPPDTLQPELPH